MGLGRSDALVVQLGQQRPGKPSAQDAYLLVEVADSTLESDRDLKLPLFAEAGVPEFWIVNLADQCVEVYRDPQPDGTYLSRQILQPGDRIDVQELPGVSVAVSEMIG